MMLHQSTACEEEGNNIGKNPSDRARRRDVEAAFDRVLCFCSLPSLSSGQKFCHRLANYLHSAAGDSRRLHGRRETERVDSGAADATE